MTTQPHVKIPRDPADKGSPLVDQQAVYAALRSRDASAIADIFDEAVVDVDIMPSATLTAVKCILQYVGEEVIQTSIYRRDRYQPWGGDLPFPTKLTELWDIVTNCVGLNDKCLEGPDMRTIINGIVEGVESANAHAGFDLQRRRAYQVHPTEARLVANAGQTVVLYVMEARPPRY